MSSETVTTISVEVFDDKTALINGELYELKTEKHGDLVLHRVKAWMTEAIKNGQININDDLVLEYIKRMLGYTS